MIRSKLTSMVITFIVVLLLIGYNNKQVNCFIENNIPTKFIGISSITWFRFVHPNYNFSFKYPACWEIEVESVSGLDFITVSKWIRGNLYQINLYQSKTPDINQNPETKKTVTIGKNNIKASYSEISNAFTSTSGHVRRVGKGYDKVYSFQVDTNKYLTIQYTYEHSVNGKKYTEPEIGREVADKLVQSVIIENCPIWKFFSQYCSKCPRLFL